MFLTIRESPFLEMSCGQVRFSDPRRARPGHECPIEAHGCRARGRRGSQRLPGIPGVHSAGKPCALYRQRASHVMHECYVCLEPCTERSSCRCKTLYVHRACLNRMILKGFRHCPVCMAPLPTLRVWLKWMFCLWLLKVMAG